MNQSQQFQDQWKHIDQAAEQLIRVREACRVARDLVRWGVMSRKEAARWLRVQLFLLGAVPSAHLPKAKTSKHKPSSTPTDAHTHTESTSLQIYCPF